MAWSCVRSTMPEDASTTKALPQRTEGASVCEVFGGSPCKHVQQQATSPGVATVKFRLAHLEQRIQFGAASLIRPRQRMVEVHTEQPLNVRAALVPVLGDCHGIDAGCETNLWAGLVGEWATLGVN
eukprot:3152397-Amphidinium_carterae.1